MSPGADTFAALTSTAPTNAAGVRYREIAGRPNASVNTVGTHVSNVLRKLQPSNRHGLTRWAARRRLV